MATLLLGACAGDPTDAAPTDAAPTAPAGAGAGEVAPGCAEVPRLEAQPAPEGSPVAATTDEPLETSDAPDPSGDSDDLAGMALVEAIEAWGEREAPDSYAGVWQEDAIGGFAVAFSHDVEPYAERIRAEVHPGLGVAAATNSLAELREIQDDLLEVMQGEQDVEDGRVFSSGGANLQNRVSIGIVGPSPERLQELSDRYGATAICFEVEPAPELPDEAVDVLAKVDGWRDALRTAVMSDRMLEVAYDLPTAQMAWADNVPEDLEALDDEPPAAAGRYSELADVDFEQQVVVVYSSGESSSCPQWIIRVETSDAVVSVMTDDPGGFCTADLSLFTVIAAVDRDAVPPVGALSDVRLGGDEGAEVREYGTDFD